MEEEIWTVVIVDSIEYKDYQVSSYGRLQSIRSGLFIKGSLDEKGYVRVTLVRRENGKKIRKNAKMHRVVMESFKIPKPEGCNQVDHINGNKEMNRLSNLEWVNCKTNIKRSWDTGLHDNDLRCGQHGHSVKYKLEDIELACHLKEKGMKTAEISRKLNIPFSTLSKIFTGKQWNNISSKYKL